MQKQRDYARDNKGDHAKIGQFVEFLSEVMGDLEVMEIDLSSKPNQKRKRLNSSTI